MNLPIAERELRIAARTPRIYRGRLIACGIFGVITGWMFWFSTKVAPITTVAPQTYSFISQMLLIMCMFSVNITCDALSAEKRNGTLGLLFLTDLRGADIVFGKLAAFGLVAFYSLLGLIPILALPVLMGGISGQSVFRTALTLANSLFFALSLGLWVSSRSWEQKRAMSASVWIVIFMMWLLPALSTVLRIRYGWIEFSNFLYLLSPMYQQDHANPFGLGMVAEKYWRSLAITHGLAWLALWRACATLPHAWQDRAMVSAVGRWRKFFHEFRFGSSEQRAALRSRLLRINAVHWLSSREKSARTNAWLFVLVVLIGWLLIGAWIHFNVRNGPPFIALGFPAMMILYLGLRVRTCGLASEVIARDRFSGALELLLSTTLTERDVAAGQWLTFARTLLGPAIATLLVGTGLLTGMLNDLASSEQSNALIAYVCLGSLFICDLVASMWTGMWTACISRTAAAAPGQAVLRLLLLPWILFMLSMTIGSFLGIGRSMEGIEVFCGWWALCMCNNIFWIVRSRRNFYERLRSSAAERYQPAESHPPWWRFLSRRKLVQQISLS
jgi:ABC-type transport system involved in multi-copper enzyme maturation permease subunit